MSLPTATDGSLLFLAYGLGWAHLDDPDYSLHLEMNLQSVFCHIR